MYVADVGAAVGDTALLLLERCGDRIKQLDCVGAESAFAELLEKNLAQYAGQGASGGAVRQGWLGGVPRA